MNTLISKVRKSLALLSIGALLSTMVVVSSASAAWYDAAVAKLGDASYATMTPEAREAALSATTSRQDAAVILHRALGSQAPTLTVAELPFTDKAEVAPYALNAVLSLYEEMIIKGNPNGTFTPAAGLNRAEFAVMLERAGVLGETMTPATPAMDAEFVGVEWAKSAFQKATAAGIIQGYPDGTLRPAGPVNKAEAMVLSVRATGGETMAPEDDEDDAEEDDNYDVTSPLDGGAGDLEIIRRSAGVESEVEEAAEDTVVLSFEVEAKDSDAQLSSLRVELKNTQTQNTTETGSVGNTRLNRYVEEVSVWQGSREVGRADADEFSESSRVYSRSIPLEDAVVREDDKVVFYVAVTAASTIDTADFNARWTAALTSVRFEDATGVVSTTDSDLNPTPFATSPGGGAGFVDAGRGNVFETFRFEDLQTSGNIEVRFARGANNPEADTREVSRTARTTEVLLNEFTIKTQASLADFIELDVNLVSELTILTDILEDVSLLVNGKEVDSQDVKDANGSSLTELVTFDVEDKLEVAEDETVTLQVVATIRSQELSAGVDRYINGSKVSASISDDGHLIEDKNEDDIANALTRGSSTGELQTLFVDGINVALVSKTAVPANNASGGLGVDDVGTFDIVFDVTAFGDDMNIGKDVVNTAITFVAGDFTDLDTDANAAADANLKIAALGTTAFTLVAGDFTDLDTAVDHAASANTAYAAAVTASEALKYELTGSLASVSAVLDSEADEETNTFEVKEGTTERFTLTVVGTPSASGLSQLRLSAIGFNVAADAAADVTYASDMSMYRTNTINLINR